MIDFQARPSNSGEGLPISNEPLGQSDNSDKNSCESCNKKLAPSILLKHIGNSKACKTYYGDRYLELKRKKKAERNEKYMSGINLKEKREKYAKNFKLKEKNKLI